MEEVENKLFNRIDIPFESSPNREVFDKISLSKAKEDPFLTLSEAIKEYDSITKETVLKDPRLMEGVYMYLENRNSVPHVGNRVKNLGKSVAKGAGIVSGASILTKKDWRDMDPEEAFETFQNHQRSFAGGHTVTSANELIFAKTSDEETKKALGAGYFLFDSMDNAFTGEGTWKEAGDALVDYVSAAVWDPTTLITFGIGKAATSAGSKGASLLARKTMVKAYQAGIKAGLSKSAAKAAAGAALKGAVYTAPDIAFNVGSDALYQSTLIETGNQKDFSKAQSAISALGAVAVPAILASSGLLKKARGKLKGTFAAYQEIDDAIIAQGKTKASAVVRKRINKKQLVDSIDSQFGKLKGNTDDFLTWGDAVTEGKKGISSRGETSTDFENISQFEKYFFLGNSEKGVKGYIEALHDSGFVMHQSLIEKYGTKSGVLAETLKWLDDSVVEKSMKNFEKATGKSLGIEYTAEAFSNHFAQRSSEFGVGLNLRKMIGNIEKAGKTNAANTLRIAANQPVDNKKIVPFALSIYKRLLTSHLATTGANLKGFYSLTGLNQLADLVTGSIDMAHAGIRRGLGDIDQAQKYYRRATGNFKGALYRTANVFAPDTSFEYVDKIFSLEPDVVERLFRDVSGDGGVRDNLKTFNLDPNNSFLRHMDNTTKAIQTLTGVRLQDDLTKKWAFDANFNQALMREYGEDVTDFFSNPDNLIEMSTDRFQKRVIDKAVFRTLRETASVNWSTMSKQKGNWLRGTAKIVEKVTNNSPVGLVVPFGSFMNTTIATMGDLSGVNALRMVLRKASGLDVDFATQEGAELVSKAIVGWTTVIAAVPSAQEKISQGLSWNQETNNKGQKTNVTYDWPASTMRLVAQMLAHADLEGDMFDYSLVPEDLKSELKMQLGGQAVRDIDDVAKQLEQTISAWEEGDADFLSHFAYPIASRVAQGITRPLDPINQMAGLVRGREMNPDLRQGSKNWNEARRYVNHIFNVTEQPKRNLPTSDGKTRIDAGKQFLGQRTSPSNSLIEEMLNSAGRAHWKQVRWTGPAMIRNLMDEHAQSFFEVEANNALKRYPDFFQSDFSLEKRNKILDNVTSKVRTDVIKLLDKSPVLQEMNALRLISGENQKIVKDVKERLGIEEELEDLVGTSEGLEKLQLIQTMIDNYDDIFGVPIE